VLSSTNTLQLAELNKKAGILFRLFFHVLNLATTTPLEKIIQKIIKLFQVSGCVSTQHHHIIRNPLFFIK